MNSTALEWLLLNGASIVLLAFFSMMEMACVSFNKVRLQYYVAKGSKRAIWLQELLRHPTSLFGTTLIMVNIALILGSEMARQCYTALGWNPDLAPLTQVALVVIFGELAPMFAARRYAESVAMGGMPLLYASTWLLHPFLKIIKAISFLGHRLFGGKEDSGDIFLSVEEIQKILQRVLEEQDGERPHPSDGDGLNAIAANIFLLRAKNAQQVMTPLKDVPMLPSTATVAQLRSAVQRSGICFAPIYHRTTHNVIGIAFPRDLLYCQETQRLREVVRSPWFVTENSALMQILKQFRSNGEGVAVILNATGHASGIITLSDVMEEIFGKREILEQESLHRIIVDRTFPATNTVSAVNAQLGIILDKRGHLTLTELMKEQLGHTPELGEVISIGAFDLAVKEASLLEPKSIAITTHH